MAKRKPQNRRDRSLANAGFDRQGNSRFPSQEELDGNILRFPGKASSAKHRERRLGMGFTPRNQAQAEYDHVIATSTIVFAKGPPGAGKTHCPTIRAAEGLDRGDYDSFIITRPAVGTDDLGAIPGTLEEKYAPWWRPVRVILEKYFGKGGVECKLKSEQIRPVPLHHIQGETFERTFILIDEAENMTVQQMYLMLTRLGEGSKIVICGDDHQKVISGPSGLTHAMDLLAGKVPEIQSYEFSEEDIVRHPLLKFIVKAYRNQ